jgi:hypothetical protein
MSPAPLDLWRASVIESPKKNRDGGPAKLLMLPCSPDDPRKKDLEYLKIYMTPEERTWLSELKLGWGPEGLELAGQREKTEAVNARALIRGAMYAALSWAPDLTTLFPTPAPAPDTAGVLLSPLQQISPSIKDLGSNLAQRMRDIEKQLRLSKYRAQALTKVCVRLMRTVY